MTLLLTGATGFLGSHLVGGLLAAGHRVVALVRNRSHLYTIARWLEQVETVDLDAIDPRRVFDVFPDACTVIHTATSYGRSIGRCAVIDANVRLPIALLDGLQARGGGIFVNTDTCFTKVAGSYRYLSAYTTSKQHMLDWLRLVAGDGDVGVANLRVEHPYGPADAPSKMVTDMIRRCLSGADAIDLTPGEQERDFVYIDDVVAAYLTVLAHGLPRPGELIEYQVGRGEAVSIRELMTQIVELCGSTTRLNFGALPYRDNEIMHSVADLTALRALGYRPRVGLREGLARTVAAERVTLLQPNGDKPHEGRG